MLELKVVLPQLNSRKGKIFSLIIYSIKRLSYYVSFLLTFIPSSSLHNISKISQSSALFPLDVISSVILRLTLCKHKEFQANVSPTHTNSLLDVSNNCEQILILFVYFHPDAGTYQDMSEKLQECHCFKHQNTNNIECKQKLKCH